MMKQTGSNSDKKRSICRYDKSWSIMTNHLPWCEMTPQFGNDNFGVQPFKSRRCCQLRAIQRMLPSCLLVMIVKAVYISISSQLWAEIPHQPGPSQGISNQIWQLPPLCRGLLQWNQSKFWNVYHWTNSSWPSLYRFWAMFFKFFGDVTHLRSLRPTAWRLYHCGHLSVWI